MASGVSVTDDVVTAYNELKTRHAYRFAVFKLSDDMSQVVVEQLAEPSKTYDDFLAALPKADCRFAVFDYAYKLEDGSSREKLIFVAWCPEEAKMKPKMVYASSANTLKQKLVGFHHAIQATGFDDLDQEDVYNAVSAKGTK